MSGSKVVVYGNGSVAGLVYNELTYNTPHEVVAFCVDRDIKNESELRGLPLVAFEDVVSHYDPETYKMFIAVGYHQMNKIREARYLQAKKLGYKFINIIAKTAITYPCLEIGENCFIGHFTVVHPDVKIGNNVLVGSTCMLAHHLDLGDNCFIADHVAISGWAKVMNNCFFGTGSTIRNKVSIGRESIIGAGAVIMEDVEERSVYFSDAANKMGVTSDHLDIK